MWGAHGITLTNAHNYLALCTRISNILKFKHRKLKQLNGLFVNLHRVEIVNLTRQHACWQTGHSPHFVPSRQLPGKKLFGDKQPVLELYRGETVPRWQLSLWNPTDCNGLFYYKRVFSKKLFLQLRLTLMWSTPYTLPGTWALAKVFAYFDTFTDVKEWNDECPDSNENFHSSVQKMMPPPLPLNILSQDTLKDDIIFRRPRTNISVSSKIFCARTIHNNLRKRHIVPEDTSYHTPLTFYPYTLEDTRVDSMSCSVCCRIRKTIT